MDPARPHIAQGPPARVREILDRLPAKYLDALESNPKLLPCCRKAKDHQVQFFRTHEDAPGPDLLVLECACGRKHYRMAAGAGRIP